MRAQSLSSCLTLCDPMDCSPQGSSVHEFLQERISVVMPSSRDFSNPGIELVSPESPALQADSLPTEPTGKAYNVDTPE